MITINKHTMQQLEELRQILTHANTLMLQLLKQQDNPVADRQEQPKDYEILAIRATDKHETCAGQIYNINSMSDQEGYTCSPAWEIYQVKRLSDDTVWMLGDTICHKSTPYRIVIDNFHISEEGAMFANPDNNSALYFHLNNWKKSQPEKEFTTADGATVNEGDTVWYAPRGRRPKKCNAQSGLNWSNHYSTRDLADRPLFTTVDGKPAYDGDVIYWTDRIDYILTSKINEAPVSVHTDRVAFQYGYSTREAAEAGYKKWLYSQPVLSIDDIAGQPLAVIVDIAKKKIAER